MQTDSKAEQLARAAEAGDADVVARLLGEGVPVDTCGGGRTALDLAVRHGHDDLVRLLLEAGADPEQQAGEYGELTPLAQAAMHSRTEIARVLLDAGAHPDTRCRIGFPLLFAATSAVPAPNCPEIVDLLLDRGADITQRLRDLTTLEWAVWFGQVDMVRQLLRRGADPSAKALDLANERIRRHPDARQDCEHVIEALLAAGAPGAATP
ncbi:MULTISPECIES: ankyrin repeat domain-containing protein [Streptomyces]|uniref:ankyrin repeat domain-containing protein n=1 Tax=Streptomyces TaxID=1883 RepID=UPI00068B58C4|nr:MULTISPECIES: ankyrin repeat domain-containing protein [unclassified Streptomyces]